MYRFRLVILTCAAVRERRVVVPEATAMATVASELEGMRRRTRRVEESRMKEFIASLHCFASLD